MKQFILTIQFVVALTFLSGASLVGTQSVSMSPSEALKLAFFVSNVLAPDLRIFDHTLAAGSIESKKPDKLLTTSQTLQKITSVFLHIYGWSAGAFKEIGVSEEEGFVHVLRILDLDPNAKGVVVYYTPLFDPPPRDKGAFVVLRKQGERWRREEYPIPLEAQPAALTAGKFFDPKRTALAIDAAWWMPEDPEYAYDDVIFFAWDGKGFRQGPKIRLKYDVVSLVAWDLTGDGRDELLVLGDRFYADDEAAEGKPPRGCPLEVYGSTPVGGVKWLAQYTVLFEECLGSLVLLRVGGRSYLLLVEGSKIYELFLPDGAATQPTLELRATMHMSERGVAVGDIDGDGDQELLISAMKSVQGKPEHGFFIYKFFPQ